MKFPLGFLLTVSVHPGTSGPERVPVAFCFVRPVRPGAYRKVCRSRLQSSVEEREIARRAERDRSRPATVGFLSEIRRNSFARGSAEDTSLTSGLATFRLLGLYLPTVRRKQVCT